MRLVCFKNKIADLEGMLVLCPGTILCRCMVCDHVFRL